tara:strand:- start:163 stop:591 length:429 start_codon:yes stop_codon:yes gene_type:complete
MELIYFILGFLFTVTGYGIVLLTKTKSSYTTLLDELHSYEEISNKEYEVIHNRCHTFEKSIEQVSEYYKGIQKQMEHDAYEGNSKLNERITELAGLFNGQGNSNKKLFDVADNQLRNMNMDITLLKKRLKTQSDDPTFNSRY